MNQMLRGPDCVLALDTLGTHASTAILGIVAIRFNLETPSEPGEETSIDINPGSNYNAGRSFETQAFQHWAERPDFQEVFGRDGKDLHAGLTELTQFCEGVQHVWATGGGFETSILANAYEHFGELPPWNYWNVLCIRTLCSLTSWVNQESMPPSYVGATTLLTARLRARALYTAYNHLKTKAVHA